MAQQENRQECHIPSLASSSPSMVNKNTLFQVEGMIIFEGFFHRGIPTLINWYIHEEGPIHGHVANWLFNDSDTFKTSKSTKRNQYYPSIRDAMNICVTSEINF